MKKRPFRADSGLSLKHSWPVKTIGSGTGFKAHTTAIPRSFNHLSITFANEHERPLSLFTGLKAPQKRLLDAVLLLACLLILCGSGLGPEPLGLALLALTLFHRTRGNSLLWKPAAALRFVPERGFLYLHEQRGWCPAVLDQSLCLDQVAMLKLRGADQQRRHVLLLRCNQVPSAYRRLRVLCQYWPHGQERINLS